MSIETTIEEFINLTNLSFYILKGYLARDRGSLLEPLAGKHP